MDLTGIIDRWLAANPLSAHWSGLHQYDGRLASHSDDLLNARATEIKQDLQILEKMGQPSDRMLQFEYYLTVSALQTELYLIETVAEHKLSPLPFIEQLDIVESSYAVRSFDTVSNRLRSIISILEWVPQVIDELGTHLMIDGQPLALARPKVDMSIKMLSGFISYYRDQLIEFATQSDDEDLIEEWSHANTVAVETMEALLTQLKDEFMPVAHDDFRLGSDKFLQLLRSTEGVDLNIDDLLAAGEAELKRNYDSITAIAAELDYDSVNAMIEVMDRDYPAPEDLFTYVEESLERSKQFVLDTGVLTIPEEHLDKQCAVVPYPESQRAFAFAAMNLPGPFEVKEAAEAYYYVNPADPSWDADKIHQHMTLFSRGGTESITVHEAWPGHYLQLLYSYTTESRIAKLLANSYALVEGWGLYAEEMIYEAGYDPLQEGGNRPRYRVGQLREALLRDVRYIVAIRMHCSDMTIEEAVTMFMEKSFLSEANAIIEANRGTVDPLYLNYTLGKLMIKKLRDDY
ncbi:MAG: DUF885 domain-containing protein, partial [Candidatus Kariarchaeaceae archaeon]